MSETVFMQGKLIPVKSESTDLEEIAMQVCSERGWVKDEDSDSYIEILREEGYKEYVVIGDVIFRVQVDHKDPYEGIFQASKNDNGSYDFLVRYYDGGCSFDEVVKKAIQNIE